MKLYEISGDKNQQVVLMRLRGITPYDVIQLDEDGKYRTFDVQVKDRLVNNAGLKCEELEMIPRKELKAKEKEIKKLKAAIKALEGSAMADKEA